MPRPSDSSSRGPRPPRPGPSRSPGRPAGVRVLRLLTATCLVLTALPPAGAPLPAGRAEPVAAEPAAAAAIPRDFTAFQRDISPRVAATLAAKPGHYRHVEPALHHLALQHADRLAALGDDERIETLARLCRFIDAKRHDTAALPVLAPDRDCLGLLDPDTGLDPREITTIATAYRCRPTVFKRAAPGETIAGVADAFLAAVTRTIAAGRPTTIVVLGHGLPTEIQSYAIRFERLAEALLAGAGAGAGAEPPVDLGHVVLICDDCFSADFLINLQDELVRRCRERGRDLASLPVCIAGTDRDRVGHADVGEKFVPHFWRDVIELYFIRRPLPDAVVLRNFFDNVDAMMYGYGRAPIMDGTRITGWRLVDPELVQDPVVFVPLGPDDLAELRGILGLPADAPLARWLDVG